MEGTQKILSDMLDIMQRQQSEINELKKTSGSGEQTTKLKDDEVSLEMKELIAERKVASEAAAKTANKFNM